MLFFDPQFAWGNPYIVTLTTSLYSGDIFNHFVLFRFFVSWFINTNHKATAHHCLNMTTVVKTAVKERIGLAMRDYINTLASTCGNSTASLTRKPVAPPG